MISINEINELQKENDFLKKELKCNKQLRGRLQNELMKSDREVEKREEKTKKLKTCLQEIKEIAENSCCMTDKDFCNENSCTVCESVSDGDRIKQILQKITEVENV